MTLDNMGCLKLNDRDYNNIHIATTENNLDLRHAFEAELHKNNIRTKDVLNIEISDGQINNKSYLELYTKIVYSSWGR